MTTINDGLVLDETAENNFKLVDDLTNSEEGI
jgi:hypothetical protein